MTARTADPRAGGDDNLLGKVSAAAGVDRHSRIAVTTDRDDDFVGVNGGAVLARESQLRSNTEFRP